jgi:PAS domain S-box-containing protein
MRELERALNAIERDTRRPEAEQRKRAETVRSGLAGIPAAVLIANDRGRYIDANRGAALLTGYTRAELLRLTVADLTPPGRGSLFERLWREFLVRGRMSGTYALRCKDGRLIRPRYVAMSNVLPGIHVSALVTIGLARALATTQPPATRRARRHVR